MSVGSARSRLAAAYSFLVHAEGSTRPLALMRIGLVAIVWARFADEQVLLEHVRDRLWPFSLVYFVSTTLAFVGLWTRASMPVVAGCTLVLVYYVGHVMNVDSNLHHHATLLAWATLWLSLGPSGGSYSIDRYLAVRKAERFGAPPPAERGPLFAQRLIALQVSAVYFWTGLDKCHAGFLSGARLEHLAMRYYTGSDPLLPPLALALALAAPLTVALELSLSIGMWSSRARKWLVIPGLVLHGLFYALFHISTFTATMWLLYLAYFDPDEVHRVLDQVQGHASGADRGPRAMTKAAAGSEPAGEG